VRVVFILNDPPYGTECSYNALRLATSVLKVDPSTQVTVFLLGDAVVAAKRGQKTPEGFYNMEHMLHRVLAGNSEVLLCGTCMDARGFADAEAIDGALRSTMDTLAAMTAAADKVLVF
jgi:uncharacterized protein involved in oxidation of intracellular sulfur